MGFTHPECCPQAHLPSLRGFSSGCVSGSIRHFSKWLPRRILSDVSPPPRENTWQLCASSPGDFLEQIRTKRRGSPSQCGSLGEEVMQESNAAWTWSEAFVEALECA